MTRLQRLLHARVWILLALALAFIVGAGVFVRERSVEAIEAARTSGGSR